MHDGVMLRQFQYTDPFHLCMYLESPQKPQKYFGARLIDWIVLEAY